MLKKRLTRAYSFNISFRARRTELRNHFFFPHLIYRANRAGCIFIRRNQILRDRQQAARAGLLYGNERNEFTRRRNNLRRRAAPSGTVYSIRSIYVRGACFVGPRIGHEYGRASPCATLPRRNTPHHRPF